MTQKRIKRIKATEVWPFDGVAYFRINASDIRALAEQLLDHMDDGFNRIPGDRLKNMRENKLTAVLYALKRAGMTPGRKERVK